MTNNINNRQIERFLEWSKLNTSKHYYKHYKAGIEQRNKLSKRELKHALPFGNEQIKSIKDEAFFAGLSLNPPKGASGKLGNLNAQGKRVDSSQRSTIQIRVNSEFKAKLPKKNLSAFIIDLIESEILKSSIDPNSINLNSGNDSHIVIRIDKALKDQAISHSLKLGFSSLSSFILKLLSSKINQ